MPDQPPRPPRHELAETKVGRFHADTLSEVTGLVAREPVVVIGMGWNPHVRRARRALDAAGVAYTYYGVGNYLTGWKPRLAIKMWSGWPTFPQVFVQGELIGGADQAQKALAEGIITDKLAKASA